MDLLAGKAPRFERIQDPDDPRLDPYRDVKDAEWVRRKGLFLAESLKVIQCLLEGQRFHVRSLLLTDTALGHLAPLLEPAEFPVYVLERSALKDLAGVHFHQGCVAVAEIPPDVFLEREPQWDDPLILALEAVVDPDNVGGSFRNALAFGAGRVLLGPRCVHPLYRKSVRTSLGASLELPFCGVRRWPEDLAVLRSCGYTLIALTPRHDAIDIHEFGESRTIPERTLLLAGGEGYGLSPEALEVCDHRVRIPMAAGVDSLNVATATGVALQRFAPASLRG